MSIIRLHKLTLVGMAREKGEVLERLQELGCMHLLPLKAETRTPEELPPERAEHARKALRYLMEVPEKRHQIRHYEGFSMDAAVFAALANQTRLRDVSDRRDALKQRIRDLSAWGDFQLPQLGELYGERLWFYLVPRAQMSRLAGLDLPWQEVHRDAHAAWVVVISAEEPPRHRMPVERMRTGALSLGRLRQRLEETELELEDIAAERQSLTRWIYLMSSRLAAAEDTAALKHAASQTFDDPELFAVQGWVPVRESSALQALADARRLAMVIEPPGPGDNPPTLLENPGTLAAGQDLVGFYQMPGYHSWDPSQVLFFSFALFFAMILSDAGYAALLGVLLGLYWRRMGRSDTGRRFRILSGLLVGGSLLWGVLVGSYFGFSPPQSGILDRLAIFDLHDFDSMMRLSVGIGVLHLVLANGQKAFVHWGSAEGGASLGWILVMLGGYALWLGGDGGFAHSLGQAGIAVGLGLVLLTGSDRPVQDLRSALWRFLEGLRALTDVTKMFGDVLSYLRLFALGLASASLALTFNDLARQVHQEVEGLGLLFAILILLAGHLLNLALGVMSGVVHGLRLNFIEFYNWALTGEGYPFRPFRKKELQE
jgi:V/A-type H+-transporting ATPase subunit I